MSWEQEKQALQRRITNTAADKIEGLIESLKPRQLMMLEELTGEKYHYSPWRDEIPKDAWDSALESSAPGSCWRVVEADWETQRALPNGKVFSVHAIKDDAYKAAEDWNNVAWGECCQGHQSIPYVDVVK